MARCNRNFAVVLRGKLKTLLAYLFLQLFLFFNEFVRLGSSSKNILPKRPHHLVLCTLACSQLKIQQQKHVLVARRARLICASCPKFEGGALGHIMVQLMDGLTNNLGNWMYFKIISDQKRRTHTRCIKKAICRTAIRRKLTCSQGPQNVAC